MAIKRENKKSSADSEKMRKADNTDLIRARPHLKDKKSQKDYEAGIDPQDEQLNPLPEGDGSQRGDIKPGEGNRLHDDTRESKTPK